MPLWRYPIVRHNTLQYIHNNKKNIRVLSASATIIPWPKTLPEQVSAVAGLLQDTAAPLHPRGVARAFKSKQASSMTPVLDALAAIGQARKLADGRYAA